MSKTKLFVGNLPSAAEENQLQALFGNDGRKVVSVKILNDRATGRSRGFGFVEMATPGDAQRAIDALNGKEFLGRPLLVSEARETGPSGDGESGGGGGTFRDRSGREHRF